jgi:hypothetical protein
VSLRWKITALCAAAIVCAVALLCARKWTSARSSQSTTYSESSDKLPPSVVETEIALVLKPVTVLDELSRAMDQPAGPDRDARMLKTLRVWADEDLSAAAKWAHSQELIDRSEAIAAVLSVAKSRQEAAELLVVQLSVANPEHADEYGALWIRTLAEFGAHERAAAFAATGPAQIATHWVTSAFTAWANVDPEAACIAAAELNSTALQRTAFEAATSAWARRDPQQLARYAVNFPAGSEQNFAIVAALRAWAQRDPNGTANWIQANRDRLASIPKLERILED